MDKTAFLASWDPTMEEFQREIAANWEGRKQWEGGCAMWVELMTEIYLDDSQIAKDVT